MAVRISVRQNCGGPAMKRATVSLPRSKRTASIGTGVAFAADSGREVLTLPETLTQLVTMSPVAETLGKPS